MANPVRSEWDKQKIFNDPIYGFVSIPSRFIFDLIEHPYLQRLRRISQLGMSHLVYPGALHTRFHHVIGAMHLMNTAIAVIRKKGHIISAQEEQAVLAAMLLHDIGHGPFSHALEHDILHQVNHEKVSELFIKQIEQEKKNDHEKEKLKLTRLIFANQYNKPFLCQLVSSQLDMDRLDYLNRDSFYTGVNEGVIGSNRIIDMLNVHQGQLVLEEKGIYSLDRFITARRLMYWQVYLHKTVVSTERLLIRILQRARYLLRTSPEKFKLFASPPLLYFLENTVTLKEIESDPSILHLFAQLDDNDILGAIKVWQFCEDTILAELSKRLVNRRLFKIKIAREAFSNEQIVSKKREVSRHLNIPIEQTDYFVDTGRLINNAYRKEQHTIQILLKNNTTAQLSDISDNLNLSPISQDKFFFCYPEL